MGRKVVDTTGSVSVDVVLPQKVIYMVKVRRLGEVIEEGGTKL